VVLLTDGFIGNEAEAFAAVHRYRHAARVFSFGIGSSVNRHLLEGVARAGGGLASYLALGEDPQRVVDGFFKRMRQPALTDLQLAWHGVQASDLRPAFVPPLYPGSALLLTGRYQDARDRFDGPAEVRITAYEEGAAARRLSLSVDRRGDSGDEVAVIWARRTLQDWNDELARTGDRELAFAMRDLALAHGLVSPYTSFVAVDSARPVGPGDPVTIEQPTVDPAGSFGSEGPGGATTDDDQNDGQWYR
jgi:Ca-activated chloride channel family protein